MEQAVKWKIVYHWCQAKGLIKEIKIKRTRRNNFPVFEAKVAQVVLAGEKTLTELTQQYGVNPNQITKWKQQLGPSPTVTQ
jgi:hypothetical protein